MEAVFDKAFRIGRADRCGVRVHSHFVSREHAEVIFENGTWQIRDLKSINGLYVDKERVPQATVEPSVRVRFGRQGPVLSFWEDEAPPPSDPSVHATPRSSSSESGYTSDESVSQIFRHYFQADQNQPAGERTQLIRQVYARIQQQQKRTYTGIIATVGALLVVALIAMGWMAYLNLQMEQEAKNIFAENKRMDLRLAQWQAKLLEENPDADLLAEIEKMQAGRHERAQYYEGFIEKHGRFRRLNDEEKLIYQTARIFNESELSMPEEFVEEVKRYIDLWQTQNRGTYVTAIRRAHDNGYTRLIVETMQQYGLPPEFFFLAMQESVFDPKTYGISTRWGIAKGMWQFIPSTAKTYGLQPGPYEALRVYDPKDQRHDVRLSTDAAARYLLYIYSSPAQASGLLVMASYNWGERRVINKLKDIPSSQDLPSDKVIRLMMEGIPMNPDERNYWGFLTTYEDRMPKETKDYVLKIFSAAVIGQDPRFFGFGFDPPLKPYMEQATVTDSSALTMEP